MRLRVAGRARRARSKRLTFALIAAAASVMLTAAIGAGAASAKPVTVGSPLQGSFASTRINTVVTLMNATLPESGANVTSPVTGTVVKWHIIQATGGPFFLVIATHNTNGSYTGTAISTANAPATLGTQTYSTDLPIKTGQAVGLNDSNTNDHIGVIAPAGATFLAMAPPLTPGVTENAGCCGPDEVGFNAIVQPLPSVSKLSPRSASHKGGKKITIKGKNFDGTTKVLFGKKAAKSFKVISDTKIKAVAPKHTKGTVHVIVENPGKSSSSKASKFKFKKS